MSQSRQHARDRRTFLKDASILSVAAAGFAAMQQSVSAQDSSANQLEAIDLGSKPGVFSSGAVVVVKTNYVYVTYQGTQYGDDGSAIGDGIAVIQLQDCAARRNRFPGDAGIADHPVDIESLGACETYEVHNSAWAEGDAQMRHFIFTFIGFAPGVCERAMNFECLARNANGYLLETESFDEALEFIDLLEMNESESEEQEDTSGDSSGEAGDEGDTYADESAEETYSEDTAPDDYYSDEYYDDYYSE